MGKVMGSAATVAAALLMVLSLSFPTGAAGTSVLKIVNKCPITLWSHITEMPAVNKFNGGKAVKLLPQEFVIYDTVTNFGAGRNWVYYKEPPAHAASTAAPLMGERYNGFCEFTVETHAQNYNVSFVDYATLPVSLQGKRAAGLPECDKTIVAWSFEDWKKHLAGCPTELVDDTLGIGRCLSSYFYCVKWGRDKTDEYCTKMEQAYGYSGLAIYGGSFGGASFSFFDSVAGWNRGTFAGDPDSANYYLGPEKVDGKWVKPYNHFAKWVHKDLASEVYAFANDDHQNHSGFTRCEDCDTLEIVWCPCEDEAYERNPYNPVMRLEQEKFMRYQLVAPNGRIIKSGAVTSMEEVGKALRITLPHGVYIAGLYDKKGGLVSKRKLLVAR